MILSWKNNRGYAAAPGRRAYGRREPARFAHLRTALAGRLPAFRKIAWVRPAYRRRAMLARRLVVWLVTATLLATVILTVHSTALRVNGAVVLARRELPGMPVFFCQNDAAWSAERMGASTRTLGQSGDGVTCLASLIEMQQIPTPIEGAVNPGTLNAWLTQCDAYDASGDLNWQRVADVLGVSLVERQPGWGVSRNLEYLLQHEIYPVVRVKRHDTGAFHDVLVVATVHGEFVIMDPLDPTGIANSLSLYDNRIYAVKYLK